MRPTLLLVVLMLVAMVSPAWAQVSALAAIDQELRAHFPEVASIKAVELEKLMGSKLRPIVIDVREPEEFAVSRLQGTVRIDPDAELDDVLRAIGPELEDRIIIVYCSVGVRSTELAERVGGAEVPGGQPNRRSERRNIWLAYRDAGLDARHAENTLC